MNEHEIGSSSHIIIEEKNNEQVKKRKSVEKDPEDEQRKEDQNEIDISRRNTEVDQGKPTGNHFSASPK